MNGKKVRNKWEKKVRAGERENGRMQVKVGKLKKKCVKRKWLSHTPSVCVIYTVFVILKLQNQPLSGLRRPGRTRAHTRMFGHWPSAGAAAATVIAQTHRLANSVYSITKRMVNGELRLVKGVL